MNKGTKLDYQNRNRGLLCRFVGCRAVASKHQAREGFSYKDRTISTATGLKTPNVEKVGKIWASASMKTDSILNFKFLLLS